MYFIFVFDCFRNLVLFPCSVISLLFCFLCLSFVDICLYIFATLSVTFDQIHLESLLIAKTYFNESLTLSLIAFCQTTPQNESLIKSSSWNINRPKSITLPWLHVTNLSKDITLTSFLSPVDSCGALTGRWVTILSAIANKPASFDVEGAKGFVPLRSCAVTHFNCQRLIKRIKNYCY